MLHVVREDGGGWRLRRKAEQRLARRHEVPVADQDELQLLGYGDVERCASEVIMERNDVRLGYESINQMCY